MKILEGLSSPKSFVLTKWGDFAHSLDQQFLDVSLFACFRADTLDGRRQRR